MYIVPNICQIAVFMEDLFNWLFLGKPSYCCGKIILVEFEHKGVLTKSKAYSSNIAFMESKKEALKQLEVYIQEFDKAIWAAAPPFIIKFMYWTVPMLITTMVFLYKK